MGFDVATATLSPPRPRGNLLTGHLAPMSRDPLGRLTGFAREHGDVVGLRLLHLPALLVSHPDLIAQVLVTRSAQFVKSMDLRSTRMVLGDGLLTSEGDQWRRWRRLMQPAFHQECIATYCRAMTASAREISSRWRDGETLELRREMTGLTLRSATRALFGADVADEEDRIGRAIDALCRLFDLSSAWVYLLPNYLPTPTHLRALAAIRRLDRVIARIVTSRRARGGAGDDLLGRILEAAEGENGRGSGIVRDQLMTLLIAGHETTSAALCWIWYLLSQHPEAEAQLHRELETALGGREARFEDLARLPYAGRVIDEALRLYPPAWLVGREAAEDTQIGDYPVRRGTTVYMSQWVVQRDARFFPEPERFHPDRWTQEFSRQLPAFAYFPFGGGPRVCIGAAFAHTEAVLALATIAQQYRFTLVPGARVAPWPSVTLRPRHGLPVIAHRREPAKGSGGQAAGCSPITG
ncbi:MAG TPA: cytochrome P450 [Candidatus Acidoferrales bacterium]|nr:cytochrome P450 [Candidatus Acidoferrales bacterium]